MILYLLRRESLMRGWGRIIDPTVDCVFTTLFGNPDHPNVLLGLLNAVLQPAKRFVSVHILNPILEPQHIGDDKAILDVEATDENGIC